MTSFVARWRALSRRARAFALALGAVAVAACFVAVALQRDARVPLFAAPLRPEQVSEVVEQLAAWNVGFLAAADNVRVDASHRNALLLRLAVAGIPHAHVTTSHEALEKASPLEPESVLDARAREGLAGDLAQALRGFAGIDDAQVVLAPAVSGGFADDAAHPASASVRVVLRPGMHLRRDAADAIRAFVASGVAGLDASHVAVLDDRGLALADGSGGDGDAGALQQSLQSALDEAFGAGSTIVRVRITYDPRARDVRETVEAPLGALRSTTADERYDGGAKSFAKRRVTEDRGSDVRDERVQTPPGRVPRVTAAVAVDAGLGLDLTKIASLSEAVLGLEVSHGDVLRVEGVPFRRATPARAPIVAMAFGWLAACAPLAAVVVLAGVALRFGAEPLAKGLEALAHRLTVRRTQRALSGVAPAHVRGALRGEPPHAAAAIISALPAATATAVLELYPPEERAAIVRRLAQAAAPAVPDYESVLRRA